jgi:hypothetical protein
LRGPAFCSCGSDEENREEEGGAAAAGMTSRMITERRRGARTLYTAGNSCGEGKIETHQVTYPFHGTHLSLALILRTDQSANRKQNRVSTHRMPEGFKEGNARLGRE